MNRTVITMVHGTFARCADWIKEDSSISKHLCENIDGNTKIVTFKWSGGNSHAARLEGSEKLKKQIQTTATHYKKQGETVDQFIIAHSHGGNVAMLACKDPQISNSVRGVACLATPFLYFRRGIAASLLSFIAYILLFFVPVFCLVDSGRLILTNQSFAYSVLGSMMAIVVIGIAWISVISFAKQNSEEFLNTVRLPDLPVQKVKIIRTLGDEASGVLIGAAFLNWASAFIYSFVFSKANKLTDRVMSSFWGVVLTASFFLLLIAIGYLADYYAVAENLFKVIELHSAKVAFYFLAVPLAVLAAVRFVFSLFLGWDIPFRYSSYMVTAEQVPTTGSYELTVIKPIVKKGKTADELIPLLERETNTWESIKHSEVYKHPFVFKELVNWMIKLKARPDRASSTVEEIKND